MVKQYYVELSSGKKLGSTTLANARKQAFDYLLNGKYRMAYVRGDGFGYCDSIHKMSYLYKKDGVTHYANFFKWWGNNGHIYLNRSNKPIAKPNRKIREESWVNPKPGWVEDRLIKTKVAKPKNEYAGKYVVHAWGDVLKEYTYDSIVDARKRSIQDFKNGIVLGAHNVSKNGVTIPLGVHSALIDGKLMNVVVQHFNYRDNGASVIQIVRANGTLMPKKYPLFGGSLHLGSYNPKLPWYLP